MTKLANCKKDVDKTLDATLTHKLVLEVVHWFALTKELIKKQLLI